MCRHRPLRYCEIFCETGILAPVEEWGHFVAASRKIGNFDKWVVIGWRSRMSKRGEVREIICKPGRKDTSWKCLKLALCDGLCIRIVRIYFESTTS